MTDHFMKWLKAYAAAISIPLGTIAVWAIGHYWTVPPEIETAIKMIVAGAGVAAVPNKDG